jgi:DNA-binding NarL/FixJ family response regulator
MWRHCGRQVGVSRLGLPHALGVYMRVIVAEHNHLMRIGLLTVLDQQEGIEVIGDVGCEEDALPLFEAEQPDVAIIDFHLPGRFEMSLVRAARSLSNVRILMLSARGEPEVVRRSFVAGVHGHVTKSAEPAEFVRAVRCVAAGRAFLSVPFGGAGFGDFLLHKERGDVPASVHPAGQPRRLSQRERQVLELFAQGHTHRQIADILGVRAKTVDTYRGRLGDKFGVRSRAELVHNARQLGLLRG